MKHKTALISLVFIGVVFLFSGNAWAGRDYRHGQYFQKRPHYGHFVPKRHGWHPYRGHHGKRFHHGPRHRGWHGRPIHRTFEKHVYHHYGSNRGYFASNRYDAAGTVSEPGFSFSFDISGTR